MYGSIDTVFYLGNMEVLIVFILFVLIDYLKTNINKYLKFNAKLGMPNIIVLLIIYGKNFFT